MPIPTPIISEAGQDADVGPGVVGGRRAGTRPISIPTAITINAGLASSPGGRVSAALPTNGHASEAAQRDRQDRQRRLELRVAPEVHEHERQQQQRADRARGEEQHPDVRVAELAVRQQAGRDHRVRRAPLPPEEQDAEQDRSLHQAEPQRQVAAERVRLDQRHREEQHRAAEQQHAAHVHLLADRAEVPGLGPPAPARARSPRIPNGMLIRKIQCQLAISISTPPITGPAAEDTSATTAISASPKPRCCGGNTSTVIAKPSGARMPAPDALEHAEARSATRPTTRRRRAPEPIVKTARPMHEELLPPELVREPAHRHQQHREHDVVGVDDPRDGRRRPWTSGPRAPGSRCSRSRRPAGTSPSRSSSRRRSATCCS